jgi:ribonuclease HI
VAEYEALINGLRIVIELGIRRLDIRGNSQLVIDQVMKESSCHNPKMVAYCQEVRKLQDKFDGPEVNHIPRWLNEAADELAKMASSREPVLQPASLPVISTSPQYVMRSQGRSTMSLLSRA